jgi:hypothetical protein
MTPLNVNLVHGESWILDERQDIDIVLIIRLVVVVVVVVMVVPDQYVL